MRLVTFALCCWFGCSLQAAESWSEALAHMPLVSAPAQLNPTNCVDLMLRSFQSNAAVKALIFMPGSTDELYMFRRVRADLPNAAPTLLDAIAALTNQTFIRATFQKPFLLLHTAEDSIDPWIAIKHQPTVDRLKNRPFLPHLVSNDRDWDNLQPIVRDKLRIDLRPWHYSRDSWHFYRHSFVGCGLNGWEILEALSLAGKSRFTVEHNRVIFEPDLRVGAMPKS